MATPKLRFKEFDGDWTSKQLGKIIGISSASRVFKEQWQDSGVPFFRTSDVVSIFKNKENEKAYISLELFEELAKKSGKIKQGDLLVTGGGSIGIPYLVPNDQPLYFKDADLLWMKSSGIVEGSFLYNFFISPKFREYLKSISHTGTISHFTIEQAKATPFGFPSKEEQTKIASFLSNVDEKISQLTQKHALLSQYKQGMMQKLFSQQLRFKADDGSEFGEWEINIICDVFTNKSKNFNPQNEGNLPCIELEHLSQNTGKILGTIESCEQQSTKNLFEKNSVLFGKLRPYLRKFAKPKFKGVCSSEIWVLTGLKISNDYLFQFVQSEQFTELTNIQSGSKMPRADWNVIADSEIEFPCLEEQTKIANFLSSIDQKIEVVAQQIEQAKQWKKGLLQQMFV